MIEISKCHQLTILKTESVEQFYK